MSESSEAVHEGGCLCGAIRYRLRGPVSWVGHCHCIQCRRAAGSPAVTWLTLPKAHFEVTKGALRILNVAPTEIGEVAESAPSRRGGAA